MPVWAFHFSSGCSTLSTFSYSLSLRGYCHPLFLFCVISQLWSASGTGDQMYQDVQIILERQRWNCVMESLTLWILNSTDCSSSAIWRGYCLQLSVILLLPVSAEQLVLALHLLPAKTTKLAKNPFLSTEQAELSLPAWFSSMVLLQLSLAFDFPQPS